MDKSPEKKPSETADLDRYERLIEVTRLAGREREAFDLYWYRLGTYSHLGWFLGEYERAYRILAGFSASGRPEDLAPTVALRERWLLANDLALFASRLGRLTEARAILQLTHEWNKTLAELKPMSIGLQNSCWLALEMGLLVEARSLGVEALCPFGKRG